MKRNALAKREIDPKRLKEFADAHNVSVGEYTKMMEEYIKGNSIYADVSEDLAEIYGKFSPYEKGSEGYKRGMKYIEAVRNYSTNDYAEYKNNLLEKEAFDMTDKAEKIFDYMTSIWKI